jgi:hypothetical protein
VIRGLETGPLVLGVDGIIFDHPDLLATAVRGRELR